MISLCPLIGWGSTFDSIDVNGMTIREGERNNQKRLETQATTQHAILAANGSGPPWTSSRVSTPAVWPAVQRSYTAEYATARRFFPFSDAPGHPLPRRGDRPAWKRFLGHV